MKYEKLDKFLEVHNGYITTAQLNDIGIPRYRIPELISEKRIRKVARGIYIDNELIEDEYYILQLRFSNLIFSHNTACHLLDLSDRAPYELDVSIPINKRIDANLNIHYVSEEKFDIGIIEINSPYGNPIKIYNAERCICDVIKNPNAVDIETYNKVLRNYFKSKNKDLVKLTNYAKKFNICDKLNIIMDVIK